ncbi:hypothetical protein [Roseomonas chloroacetimidivorans]|uniref:hypothetical protein n=1 Tax=Roseomonas chloroacetimidivorans TaxID=1766656 RepID=UPI003C796F3A
MNTLITARPTADDPFALFPERWEGRDGVHISTHCMFSNGDHVGILVRQDRKGRSFVSDNGCAWEALAAAGLDPDTGRLVTDARNYAEAHGIAFSAGEFFARDVDAEVLSGHVMHLANTVQSWVALHVSKISHVGSLSLDDRLLFALDRVYGHQVVGRHLEVAGDSTRTYEMTAVVTVAENRSAIFRTVAPVPASFFACHTAFADVALARRKDIRVAVIEGSERWQSADLALLGQAASHVIDLDRNAETAFRRLAS